MDGLVASLQQPIGYHKYSASNEVANTHLFSQIYLPGTPGAAVAPTPGINGAALTSYAGQIPFPSAVGGEAIYLAALSFSANDSNFLTLCDRLWHNSSITSTTTTNQAITSAAFPARDLDESVNGRGLMVGLEVSTATTNGSAITNTTMTYTNSSGTGSRTATIASFPATAVAGTFVPFELQAGDVGIKSIEGITLGTSYGTGVIHIVVYRPIVNISGNGGILGDQLGPIELGLPRLWDNTVPFFLTRSSSTTAKRYTAHVTFAQG